MRVGLWGYHLCSGMPKALNFAINVAWAKSKSATNPNWLVAQNVIPIEEVVCWLSPFNPTVPHSGLWNRENLGFPFVPPPSKCSSSWLWPTAVHCHRLNIWGVETLVLHEKPAVGDLVCKIRVLCWQILSSAAGLTTHIEMPITLISLPLFLKTTVPPHRFAPKNWPPQTSLPVNPTRKANQWTTSNANPEADPNRKTFKTQTEPKALCQPNPNLPKPQTKAAIYPNLTNPNWTDPQGGPPERLMQTSRPERHDRITHFRQAAEASATTM